MVRKKACRIHSECHRSMPPLLMSPLWPLLLMDPPFLFPLDPGSSPLGLPLPDLFLPGLARAGHAVSGEEGLLGPLQKPLGWGTWQHPEVPHFPFPHLFFILSWLHLSSFLRGHLGGSSSSSTLSENRGGTWQRLFFSALSCTRLTAHRPSISGSTWGSFQSSLSFMHVCVAGAPVSCAVGCVGNGLFPHPLAS